MIERAAVSLRGVSKRYRVYPRPFDRLKQAFSFGRRRYFAEVDALRDVSFSVVRGTTLGVLGRNGSGKSTLLQLIAGALQPSAGSVVTAGQPAALLELGAGFHPDFSGRENVFIYGAVRGLPRHEVAKRLPEIEAFADIGEFMDRPINTYSAGMMMRLAFSAAVHMPADLLIIDEVLAVGDAFFQSKCMAKIKELQRGGATMIVVSHDMSMIRAICSEAVVLSHGEVSFQGGANAAVEHYYQVCSEAQGSRELPALVRLAKDSAAPKPPVFWKSRRYGDGRARLRRYSINGMELAKTVNVESRSSLDIELVYEFDEIVEAPVCGIMLKTPSGIEIFGTNSWHRDIVINKRGRGDELRVSYRVKLDLHNGPYLLTTTLCEIRPETGIQYIDRHVDACLISVSGGPSAYSGFCNLDSNIEAGAPA